VNESNEMAPLIAAPRHLRKRKFHKEIPDNLLVQGADVVPLEAVPTDKPSLHDSVVSDRLKALGRKRLVALLVVIFVSISIAGLVLALIFMG
jgi:hypothetical protein